MQSREREKRRDPSLVAIKRPQPPRPAYSCLPDYKPARTGTCNLRAYTVEESANKATAVTSRPPIACWTAYVSVWAFAVRLEVRRP